LGEGGKLEGMMRRLIYKSTGTDDLAIACGTLEEAINLFKADAEVAMQEGHAIEIQLYSAEMTDEHFAALQEP
jgi:hypothetical protein